MLLFHNKTDIFLEKSAARKLCITVFTFFVTV